MATEQNVVRRPAARFPRLSLDWWAVLAALGAAALVLAGVIPNVGW